MNIKIMRSYVKSLTPKPIRFVVRCVINYFSRLLRWPSILYEIRGVSLVDETKLVISFLVSPLLSLKNMYGWQDPQLIFDVTVNVPKIGKFTLRKFSDDLWHVFPSRERANVNYILSNLKKDDFFLDAGANIGFYTVLAAKIVGPKGRVIAIEMMPDTAEKLRSHLKLNKLDNVTIVQNALSDKTDQVVIARTKVGHYGQATILNSKTEEFGFSEFKVSTTTLDEITRDIEEVSILKMDLEGAELSAIRGGALCLKKVNNIIYESFECANEDQLETALTEFGFSLSRLDGNNKVGMK